MKKKFLLVLIALVISVAAPNTLTFAAFLDDLKKNIGSSSKAGPDESTAASGLKEALSIGTEKAVKSVSQVDGYFANRAIKILMPAKLQKVGDVLRQVGYKKEVDDFVLSMNRAAEKAAPKALSFFVDAIQGMTFEDARKILSGGDTAATEFFKANTHDKLYNTFEPIISSSLDQVGATLSYKEMMSKYESIPFMSKESFDLDRYVTNKALDGLFYMVGQEEKKIRTDPTARATDLLKQVFGK